MDTTLGAEIHVVSEGLLLVAPDIFKSFAGVKWNDALKAFLKLRLHLINENSNSPYFFYRLGGLSLSKGIVIVDPKLVFESTNLPPSHGEILAAKHLKSIWPVHCQ